MTLDPDELERLEKAATPEPWVWLVNDAARPCVQWNDAGDGKAVCSCTLVRGIGDAMFIAAARNALPELLARLRRAEAVADAWIAFCAVPGDQSSLEADGEFDKALDAYREAKK